MWRIMRYSICSGKIIHLYDRCKYHSGRPPRKARATRGRERGDERPHPCSQRTTKESKKDVYLGIH